MTGLDERAATGDGSPRIGALVRDRRKQRQMTLQMLGDAAQTSVGYLSQIERDQATPSLGTLAQIARALGVRVDYFIAAPTAKDALSQADTRRKFSIDGTSIVYERLSTEFPGNRLSSFIMTVPVGYQSETVSHEGEELLYVLSGTITQSLANETMVLGAGDALHFRGNQPHAWANHGTEPAKLLWAGTLALFQSITASKILPDAHKKPDIQPVTPTSTQKEDQS
ncbi:helix-turn-helix domain-containing protein [Pelagibacterium sp.]|uniref:helix-turn-helix domain-containing protein n=1 Tax=Pelagibacterium sp. TaxID=1967288 RepID=UPI003A90B5F4